MRHDLFLLLVFLLSFGSNAFAQGNVFPLRASRADCRETTTLNHRI
jgi:hypothetical protein